MSCKMSIDEAEMLDIETLEALSYDAWCEKKEHKRKMRKHERKMLEWDARCKWLDKEMHYALTVL